MYLRMAAVTNYPVIMLILNFHNNLQFLLHCKIVTLLNFKEELRIQHSKVAIIKPQKTADQSLEELEEATRRGAVVNTGEIGRGYSPSNIGALASIPPMQMAGISSTLFNLYTIWKKETSYVVRYLLTG
ncbi:hypothetical protein ACQ4LE_004217 [Meloidogyne hapla]